MAKKTKKPDPTPRVRPRGKPLGWTPADVDRRAEVDDEQKMRAVEFWDEKTTPARKGLLRADRRRERGER